ncbi:hypothetical protein HDU98_005110, partial [Podochytrium sp. JEL0797]
MSTPREKHRHAQAKYLAKKENRIAELLQQVELLTQRRAPPQEQICAQCTNEANVLKESMLKLQSLVDMAASLELEKASLLRLSREPRWITSLPPTPAFSIASPPIDGINRDLQSMRSQLSSLPSILNNPLVEDLVKLRLEFDTLTGDQPKRMKSLQFEYTKFKMMDACTLLERRRIVEILEHFHSLHPMYVKPVHDVYHSPSMTPIPVTAQTDDPMRDQLLRIPSLRNASCLIDRFIDECGSWKGFSGDRTMWETQEYILRQNDFVRSLADLCVGEDLIQ